MQKSLKKNSVLNSIKTLSSIMFPLITFPYISRVLQPINVGKVNFGSAYVSYFSLIASLGVTTYAIRECSAVREDRDDLSKVSSEIFSINMCTTIVSYILLGLSLILFKNLISYRTIIIIQSTVILFSTLGTEWLNSAMEDFTYITLRTIIFQCISLVLIFLLVKSEEDYLIYAFISTLAASGANITNIFYRKKFCDVHFRIKMNWEKHFKPILMLFVMILAQTIFSSADITMLGIMKNDYEVGIYSTALKIANIISQLVSSLVWVIMPRMSFLFAEENFIKINEILKKVLSLLFTIGMPSIVGVWGLSKEIVYIVGGNNYLSASGPLIILMASVGFSLIGGSFLGNMVLLPSKKEDLYMKICCFSTILNLILNYLLIPIGGAIAASFTTAVSSLLIAMLLIIKKDKRIKLNKMWKVSISPFFGSVAIYIYCCFFIKKIISSYEWRLIIGILGSVIIYLVMLFILKNDLLYEVISYIRNLNQKEGRKKK